MFEPAKAFDDFNEQTENQKLLSQSAMGNRTFAKMDASAQEIDKSSVHLADKSGDGIDVSSQRPKSRDAISKKTGIGGGPKIEPDFNQPRT